MKIGKLLKRYRVGDGKHFKLKDHDPADTNGLESELKPLAKELLADGVKKLSDLQNVLAAQDRWGLLLIFQAMDAAGKDGTIKHVMSGVNPQGCQVFSFKPRAPLSWSTISFGGPRAICRRGGRSASSTGPITRRC